MRRVVSSASYETLPNIGDHRYKRKFLWRSMTIGTEGRWCELAAWREEYKRVTRLSLGHMEYEYKWVPTEWVNFS